MYPQMYFWLFHICSNVGLVFNVLIFIVNLYDHNQQCHTNSKVWEEHFICLERKNEWAQTGHPGHEAHCMTEQHLEAQCSVILFIQWKCKQQRPAHDNRLTQQLKYFVSSSTQGCMQSTGIFQNRLKKQKAKHSLSPDCSHIMWFILSHSTENLNFWFIFFFFNTTIRA